MREPRRRAAAPPPPPPPSARLPSHASPPSSTLCSYNLKRKIAGLPAVTREWFDARKAQLAAAAAGAVQRVWFDPLARKKFYSQNTYDVFTRSKKYAELVRRSGAPAPAAVVTLRRVGDAAAAAAAADAAAPAPAPVGAAPTAAPGARGYTVVPAVRGGTAAERAAATAAGGGDADAASGSDWETASEEEHGAAARPGAADWQEWDPRRSLFDGHVSADLEANLAHMYRAHGFYLPDAEFLCDPEGLVKYLGAKLAYGGVPLYQSGEDPVAKSFASLHAVQRHMVDSGRCRMLYEGNEEEYADFYDYGPDSDGEGDGASVAGSVLAAPSGAAAGRDGAAGAYELALPRTGGGVRVLGAREFARYYRQRHRPGAAAGGGFGAAARVLAQYRKLAVPLITGGGEAGATPEQQAAARRGRRSAQRAEARGRLGVHLSRNVNDNLPRNVPY